MKIKINFFASLREELGYGEMNIKTEAVSLSAEEVWMLATGQSDFPHKILIAVNQEYSDANAVIVEGDEVAFFPPVTGG